VIGEDLGTVPDGFRELMADWGVWSYRVMMFERGWDGRYHPPEAYPRDALVAFNTHDLPTFEGWTLGHDLRVKRALGLDPGETDEERIRAQEMLGHTLAQHGLGSGGRASFVDVVRYLARTPSGLLAVAIEDVLGEIEQINVPGTVNEHSNWRRRWPIDLEDLASDRRLREIGGALAAEGRRLG
jgi:4-alpha-glucanotransferase